MLSTEKPANDPPRSCNCSHLTISGNELAQLSCHQHHLPNFSIRDYVRGIRRKDIKQNWPFSPKSLELCLRHGIKDPLPPIQPLEAVRRQSYKSVTYPVNACSPDELEVAISNQTLAQPRNRLDHSSLCQFRVEIDLPSATTSFSQSEIEQVPFNKPLSKRSGLVSNLRSTEDIALYRFAISELMGSKICPVCKTFSSASNTTMNAHIDQCLSVDSASAVSKPTRNRIKPRRIRLMADVYANAKECTLEELDRRNGTNWAVISSLPLQDIYKSEVSDEGKKQRLSPVLLDEENNGVGPVYIDARGKKLRSLSEYNDNSLATFEVGKVGVKNKSLKGSKESKFSLTKKKSRRGKKRDKYLTLAPQCKRLFSQKANAFQISESQKKGSGEGSHNEEKQILVQFNPSQSRQLGHQKLAIHADYFPKRPSKKGCKWKVTRNPPVEKDRSCLEHSRAMRNLVKNCMNQSENTVSSPANDFKSSKVAEMRQPSSPRKRAQSQDFGAHVMEKKRHHLQQNCLPLCERLMQRPPFCVDASPRANSLKQSMMLPTFASKASRFPSSGAKSSFPSSEPSLTEDSANLVKKLNEARLHFTKVGHEGLMDWESEMDHDFSLTDSDTSDKGEAEETPINAISSISSDDDEKDEEDANYGYDAFDNTNDLETSKSRDFGLAKSLDADFYLSDSPPSRDICNDMAFLGEQEVCYADEVGNRILGKTAHMSMELESELRKRNSLTEVDSIPIPGPPGSFLPSPRVMGADDFPGNSWLTTSQVQSFHHQLDFIDRNSSESSISAASTLSNSTTTGTDHVKRSEELSMVQEKITSSFCTADTERRVPFVAGDEQTTNGENFTVKRISLREDDQTCCSQRRERSFDGSITPNCQESQLLRRRTIPSATLPETRGKMGFDPTIKLSISNLDSERTSSDDVDCNSMIPSASTPVLRLMGKNLMVVNNGEEASVHASLSSAEPSLTSNHQAHQFPDSSRTHQDSSAFGQDHHNRTQVNLDLGTCFGDRIKTMTPQIQAQGTTDTYQNHLGYVPYIARRL